MSTARSFAAGDVVLACEPWVWSFQYSYYKFLCAQCFQPSPNLQTCSNCKLYRFCNKDCQTANWKTEHKHECEMLKQLVLNAGPQQTRIEEDLKKRMERDVKERVAQGFLTKDSTGCGHLAGEILIAKIINKIQRGDDDDWGNGPGRMSAMEIVDMLPYEPAYDRTFKLLSRGNLRHLAWPAAAVASIPHFSQLVKKVYFNAFPVYEQREKNLGGVYATALFPHALHRRMKAVCSDISVTMNFHKRTLVLHATEDIPHYTGLQDLRQNELLGSDFLLPVEVRRNTFREIYSRECACLRGTDEYGAEINPLKCVTGGCMERIPSDHRATQPCPQCGAINADRLSKYQELIRVTEDITVASYPNIFTHPPEFYTQLLATGDADVVQTDAQCRFHLGFGRLWELKEAGRFEEAWEMYGWMIPLICNIHPKYHLARAHWLLQGGEAGCDMIAAGGQQIARRAIFLRTVVPQAVEWLKEAQHIYEKLSGKGSWWEGRAQQLLDALRQLRESG